MLEFHDSHDRFTSGRAPLERQSEHQAIEKNMVFIVRRALREKCADTTLHRRILSEARRAGSDGKLVGDDLIRTVARRLSANFVMGLQTSAKQTRNVEETIRG